MSEQHRELADPTVSDRPLRDDARPLPIIVIGASAGGLEAASRLFDAISGPDATGDDGTRAVLSAAAFLLVQHLDPNHPSRLAELLGQHTRMPVVEARDGCPIAAGHVYIIPPGCYLALVAGVLQLSAPLAPHGARMPFDFLLQSLADDCGPQVVAAILSGTGSDGSVGLAALAQADGLVIAQDPAEAEYDGMPRNAIATGQVDRVARLAEMPAVMAERIRMILGLAPPRRRAVTVMPARMVDPAALAAILSFLQEQTAQDFRQYKSGTVVRRIERRLGMLGIAAGDLPGYLELLRKRPLECDLLAKDLLIHVTGFFRDPKVFEALDRTIIPGLIDQLAPHQTLRIWVAGCSTGEEAYSIAMVCADAIATAKRGIKLQIFASDVDPEAIAVARDGLYSAEIATVVPAARLARYFTREDHGFRIASALRGDVVFTVQDVLSDPPFSRMDLVSCRNLLIYLNTEAQAKVIGLFHFALREGGILMLGSSETAGKSAGRFEIIARSERFYRHIARSRPGEAGFPTSFGDSVPRLTAPSRELTQARQSNLADICARAVIAGHAPAAVLINRQRQVLFSMGPTHRYLQVAPGYPSHDLLAMAAPALRRKLKRAIDLAAEGPDPSHGAPAPSRVSSGRTRLTLDGTTIWFSIAIDRLTGENKDLLLVCFLEEPAGEAEGQAAHGQVDAGRIAELERELAAAQAELQVSIQYEETAHQEQKAINEEALSVNQEFQSANEELLTSKEELQSLNEELTALNSQLQETLDRQRITSDDLENVLYSTNIGTLFLDRDLHIRFFTPAVNALFNIIPGDIGRPLGDLRSLAADETLLADAGQVLSGATMIEHQVAAPDATWFMRRIFPYHTHAGTIEGVVITYTNITQRKASEEALEVARLEAERANIAKSRFLAAASHDLRQPLQSLTLLKELLAQAVDGERPQKLLVRFEQTLRTISGMLNGLLDINQIEAGVIQPMPMVFPLADVFDKMRHEFGYVAQARGLVLRVIPTSELVWTDPRLLEQIIRNLLGNAIKYTGKGKILLGVRRQGQCLRIEVGDTGIGIADEELQAIFEEFHQVGNEARERSLGLGLGLSIVQRLGRLLGHAVDVRSVPGKGSLFAITVPMQQHPAAAPPPLIQGGERTPTLVDRGHRCKVVVVDDEPDILELLALMLKADGCIVRTAGNAAAALKLVAAGAIRPEILLTDYNLPGGINGLDLVERLRAQLSYHVPAIILTGDISTDTLAKIAQEDCIQLSKPVDPRELLQAMERLCPRGQALAASAKAAGLADAVTYVIDDDPDIRATIRAVLEADGHCARDYASAEAFLADYRPGGAGCLLVDVHLPGMSGVDLLNVLRARGDTMPVIVITGNGDIALAVAAMRAGACEFIEKPAGRADLLASIARAIAQSRDIRLVDAVHEEAAARIAELTERQREIMGMVLAGLASKNIAAQLGISQRTVENHRAAIMERVGVKSLPELARLVVQAETGRGGA